MCGRYHVINNLLLDVDFFVGPGQAINHWVCSRLFQV